MNDLQKKEIELLKIFVDICKRLDLRYYLVCGSALGAVKYKGFIPWDDDIDVGMPREDYEIFLKKALLMLPKNVFLQNYRTDKAFPHVFSKLRDSDTAFFEHGIDHLDINHGIYIDVFPIDGYPQKAKDIKKLKRKKKILNWKQYCTLKNSNNRLRVTIRNKIFCILGYHKRTDKTLAKLDLLISQYPTESSDVWCNHGNWQGEREYAPRWHYGKGTSAVFEGIEVIIPENYDEYLTQKYGDWRKDPPKEKQKSHHLWKICDPNKSYLEYLKK